MCFDGGNESRGCGEVDKLLVARFAQAFRVDGSPDLARADDKDTQIGHHALPMFPVE
jgi:hypothetical protein